MNEIKVIYPNMGTVEQVKAAIDKAIASAVTMKKKVQIAAIGLLIIAGKAKDKAQRDKCIELANYLVNQLGDGIRGKGLVAFLSTYGFKVDAIEPKNGFNSVMSEKFIREHFAEAKATYWWTLAPDAPFKPWDFKVELKRLLDRADKMGKDEEHKKDINIDTDLLEVARSMLEGKPVHAAGALKLVERLAA